MFGTHSCHDIYWYVYCCYSTLVSHVCTGKFPKEAQRDPTSLHSVGEVNVLDALPESDLLLKLDRNYTPKEIAEYIASTGDEKGIIQVIAEMVQDGQIMVSAIMCLVCILNEGHESRSFLLFAFI